MSPPLVRELVRGHEVEQIDIVRLLQPLDKADGLRVRDRVRKRLCKSAVTREFKNAELLKLIRAVVFPVVIETRLRGFEHATEIVFVAGLIINLEFHVVPVIALHIVAARKERKE